VGVFGPNAEVPIERLDRLAAEREYPRATALSEHGRLARSQIDVLPLQGQRTRRV
jgi:hypothetical protein